MNKHFTRNLLPRTLGLALLLATRDRLSPLVFALETAAQSLSDSSTYISHKDHDAQ
ncbi:uncharacterized protein PHALS_12148 [Plasmopara halstedii]|uniref:Uncharacterized protein n=1 Tax=Plasmopara halstedii TaxID=4781 RepID=A0A0P1AKN5_PLAHL|nr:uncharacterized protein PHALS_12148 [Plasmopara halstedii]CEG41831.1 hypothetical protein PHALS_12148 [Plasmopara halstedii]|eukprot:XP_024578200.1 hypothetical protein PHALS_12148 [Plasmopara halstedii]